MPQSSASHSEDRRERGRQKSECDDNRAQTSSLLRPFLSGTHAGPWSCRATRQGAGGQMLGSSPVWRSGGPEPQQWKNKTIKGGNPRERPLGLTSRGLSDDRAFGGWAAAWPSLCDACSHLQVVPEVAAGKGASTTQEEPPNTWASGNRVLPLISNR